jgi:hypothetical protein
MKKYPRSVYLPFIKRVIEYKVKSSDFAMGYDFFGGYGYMNGNISNNFMNLGYLGFSFNFYYFHFNLDMSIILGISKLKRDIPIQSNIWDNGMNASFVIPQAQLGYTILPSKKLNFTPFFGISGTFISPVYEDILMYPYLDNVSFNSNICWSTGMSLNIFSKPTIAFRSFNKSTQVQLFLKLKYTYTSISYSRVSYDFDGYMHQVSLIFGCLMRKNHRII